MDKLEIEDFKPDKKIGYGGMGDIWSCKNDKYAVKILKKKRDYKPTEIQLIKYPELNHINIVKCYGCIQKRTEVCYIMEHIKGITLKEHFKINKIRNMNICRQMTEAVKYCHANNIIHCDITLSNFMIIETDETVIIKLLDFDFAVPLDQSPHTKIRGTIHYMAPELFEVGKPSQYDYKIDVWSLGVCFYHLMTLKFPFPGTELKVIVNAIHKSEPSYDQIYPIIATDIKKMLTKNSKKRIELDILLKSSWLS